jgi:hypothetical protein
MPAVALERLWALYSRWFLGRGGDRHGDDGICVSAPSKWGKFLSGQNPGQMLGVFYSTQTISSHVFFSSIAPNLIFVPLFMSYMVKHSYWCAVGVVYWFMICTYSSSSHAHPARSFFNCIDLCFNWSKA